MFDNLKNLANLPGLMAKAREMQDKMQTMQEELARKQVTADAGGGMVTAIVNGRMEVVKIRIDKSSARRLLVSVQGRTLTLMGSLHSWAAKEEAERVALSVPGISKVENQIVIMP